MDSDDLCEAIELVKNGASIKKVSRDLHIEYFTLYNHIKGINRSFNKGRPTLIPDDIENELISIANYLASRNLGLNFRRFQNFARNCYKNLHPNEPEDCIPTFSLQWWKNFKERHPDFNGKRSKKIDIIKQQMYSQKDIVETFFTNYCQLSNIHSSFEARCIWNLDETGTKQFESHSYVMSGTQPNIGSINCKNKLHTTILPCVNGIGKSSPLLFIFQGESYAAEDLKYFTHSEAWGTSTSSGFINEQIFLDWLKKFIKWLDTVRNRSETHLLILDNLRSHISYDILTTAKENNIELLALPSNCTHIIQPLDINLFRIFKSKLRDKLPERIMELKTNYLSNQELVKLISEVWLSAFNPDNIKRSFELIGICPYNPQIVYDRMNKRSINSIHSNTQENTTDSKQIVESSKNNEPIVHIKSNTINSEVLNELDTVKKQLAILEAKFTQLQAETTIKKYNRTNLKITASRILTSEEAINNAKEIKDKKDKQINIDKQNITKLNETIEDGKQIKRKRGRPKKLVKSEIIESYEITEDIISNED